MSFRVARYFLLTGIIIFESSLLLSLHILSCIVNVEGIGSHKVVVAVKSSSGYYTGFKDGKLLNQDDMDKFNKILRGSRITYFITTYITLTYNGKNYKVKLVGSDSNYREFYHFNYLSGAFFTEGAENRKDKVAVIDSGLAWDIFKSTDVKDMAVTIFNQPFKIVGVISKKGSIIDRFSDDGIPAVYIPITTYMDNIQDSRMGILQVKGPAINATIVQNAMYALDKQFSYTVIDDGEGMKFVQQLPKISVFIMGFMAILSLVVLILKDGANLNAIISEKTSKYYLWEAIEASKKSIVLFVFRFFIASSAIFVLWKSIAFKLYLPFNYIPNTSKGLIQYYMDMIEKHLQLREDMAGQILLPVDMRINGALRLLIMLFLIGAFWGLPLIVMGLSGLWMAGDKCESNKG